MICTRNTATFYGVLFLASVPLAAPSQAQEVDADPAQTGDAPAPQPATAAPTAAAPTGGQVYTAADFARYAPKNALDMLVQVPGFNIRENEQMRGLGQATGNVLFNGQRTSNKGDSLGTLLQRIPASNVIRIEIVDGASLNVPGLSGQVANIVYEAEAALTGQFSWKPQFRPYNTDPLFTRGDVSISGKTGAIEYEAALNNDDAGRGGADGLTFIYDAAGNVIQTRDDAWNSKSDSPKLSGKIIWDGPGTSIGHANAHYQRIYERYDEDGFRLSPGLPDEVRTVKERTDSWNVEFGADYEFDLGPGRLKAIGLRRFNHEPFSQTIISTFADASADNGDRFAQTGDLGETIARGEYSWKMFGGDWQWSAEAALNTLENVSGLFTLDPSGKFVEVPFPGGTGGVTEDRYESLISFGRKLTGTLSFQIIGGAEHSTITQTGNNGLTRSFFRPKGTLSFAWNPSDTFDASLKIRRRVLQLSFYDFLARAFLNDDNQNAGNNQLRPQQDWSFEGEVNKKLGPWGSQQLRLIYRDVEDFVDIVPVPGGESVGNIAKSWAAAIVSTSTITFDPVGLKGLKLDGTFVLQKSSLRDPFTGETRQWSGFATRQVSLLLRHDIPASDWAYGLEASHAHFEPRYRSNQVDLMSEGRWFAGAFVEHKDVFGLAVQAGIDNILGARSYRYRTVFEGLRNASPIAFIEDRDRRIGPIFYASVRGNF
ncbi:TonB-dependent receptor plug domain-containing protein [Qipengyuania atrilutea]|uniref:TonB-dependent receptor plug domain-containing protein n=1 Tax=Qipengyuania atrilutea TaxID=2744473 RepID=A0A850H3Y3_9SPHN|nr:TonB-dependent receptor plug domain-containing protein [Actirhodobacter atriluteus]NVD45300.1 TonB-dependent receptor plug domain-containing protein [Actirhodobacter atriluteus]